jgi:hypothetical protein
MNVANTYVTVYRETETLIYSHIPTITPLHIAHKNNFFDKRMFQYYIYKCALLKKLKGENNEHKASENEANG